MHQGFKFARQLCAVSRIAALLAFASLATIAHAADAVFSESAPITLQQSVQYDLKSAITGRDYRIFISAPLDAGPDKAYPVLYLFDGNRDFPRMAGFGRGIIVAIGYPVASESRIRRVHDLTPTVDARRSQDEVSGDADRFLQALEEEIRPFVEARYNLVADNQSLYGHSFGGLAVLRHMFRNPESFNAFMIGSPSIWWDNEVVLADEAAFSERVKAGELKLRVLITSAGEEQNCTYPGLDAAAQASCNDARMVDNAGELAARLAVLNPEQLQVTRVIFDGETHGSSIAATLARAVNFAMPEPLPSVAPPPLVPTAAGLPVTLPRSQQFDFTSQVNGLTYRIFVSTPQYGAPDQALPVIYVLDGNWYFAAAADSNTRLSNGGGLLPAIVVGIGFPTDDNDQVGPRRLVELTHSVDPDRGVGGGVDAFLQMLETEVKPFVAARFNVDPARQTLYGASLGGLAVLRQLLRNPEAYSTYIAASPSIWWNKRDVLADEAQFAQRVAAGELDLRLLITSAGREQYRGDDPALLARDTARMIDNASELAARLAALNPEKVPVEYVLFPNESHGSVSLAALGRALTFALSP